MHFDSPLSFADQEFLKPVEQQIFEFIDSGHSSLELGMMNSYQRRLIHKLASICHLKSESIGEEREKIVCLHRTEQTSKPESSIVAASVPRFDYGVKMFSCVEGAEVVLKDDGSVGLKLEDERLGFIDVRVVEGNVFRIRNSKITCPGEENWA